MHIAQKFEYFLETCRQPDGRRWGGQDLHDATGGVVTRSYVTNLRKGRIENPGFEKLRAIAKVMGFPPELWFEEDLSLEAGTRAKPNADLEGVAEKINHLFEVIKEGRNGTSYTNAEVARMSLGDLTEKDVEDLRAGRVPNPPVDQVVALADVFGVHPSYFLESDKKTPLLDEEAMRALRDEKTNAILHRSVRLPDREKEMILGIIKQFEDLRETPDEP
jgi:transcriptional regulator with XRE-family HTH domain